MPETDFQAHYRCNHCHSVRPKTEVIWCDDTPICRDNPTCKEQHYERTRPHPRRVSELDDGHC
jgi:hypothetical protein